MPSQARHWTRQEILDTLAQHREHLRALGVRELGLFGSYRHDTAGPESDMDFLATLEHPSFDAYMNVKFWLEDTFGRRVDLVLPHTLKPRLRPIVLREVVYAEGLPALSGRHPGGDTAD